MRKAARRAASGSLAGAGRREAVDQGQQDARDLGPAGGVGGADEEHRRLVERAEQQVGGRADRQRPDLPRLDRRDQARLDQPEAVGGGDVAPAVPAEHGGRVVEDDPLEARLGALVEEGGDPGLHRRQRAVHLGVEDDVGDPLGRLRLDRFVDRLEQARLATREVVVERPAGQPGGLDDLLRADVVVAAGGEEVATRGDQRVARRFGAFRLRAALWLL